MKELEEVVQVEHVDQRGKFLLDIEVNDLEIKFDVDTGAAVTIMSEDDARRYFKNFRLRKTNLNLISYCKNKINVLGYINVKVKYANNTYYLNLYLTNIERMPILGREWLIKFFLDNLNTNFFAPILQIADNVDNFDPKVELDRLLNKYSNINKPDLSKINDITVNLKLKENAKPIFIKARIPPFKLIPLVEKELNALEREGLITKIDNSEWATPVVPILKKDNTVRLCGDFSITINPNIVTDYYHLPSVDELFADMSGCTIFSKIDLKQAYLQLELSKESQKFVVLNTHKGLYKCNRLWYGIASAVGIWQRNIENIFINVSEVRILIDDMRIGNKSKHEHIEKLDEIFSILHKYNIKINSDKCDFFQNEITYCEFKIDKNGIHKIKEKMQ